MNKSRAFLWPVAAVLMVGLATGASQAPTLTFHFKDVNFPGAAGTSVYGINDAGVIVGQYYDKQGVFHGFKLDHGKGTTIDDPNGSNTLCSDINSSDAIVGQYTADPSGDNHGFLYENGKFTDIAPDKLSGASGINDNGYIVPEATPTVSSANNTDSCGMDTSSSGLTSPGPCGPALAQLTIVG